MTRLQREEAKRKAIEQASRTPEGAEAVEQALREAGAENVKSLARYGATTDRGARFVHGALTRETAHRPATSLRDVLTAVATPVLSGLPSRVASACPRLG